MVEEHIFTLNNRKVRYFEAGLHHSRSLLLLHGGIGDAYQNWYGVIPLLAEDYHVLAPDLPGFGASEAIPSITQLTDMIDWIIDFMNSQDVEQFVVIGNSFGALIARLMAAQHPHKIAAVVLMNGGFVPDVPSPIKLLLGLPVIGGIVSQVLANIATSPDSLKDMIHHPEALTPELIANARANARGFAHLMRMAASRRYPVENKPMIAILVLWGTADGSTTTAEGQKLKEALGAIFVDIEDCGHLPHLEEPDIFEWQVKNFLAKQDPVKRANIPGT